MARESDRKERRVKNGGEADACKRADGERKAISIAGWQTTYTTIRKMMMKMLYDMKERRRTWKTPSSCDYEYSDGRDGR